MWDPQCHFNVTIQVVFDNPRQGICEGTIDVTNLVNFYREGALGSNSAMNQAVLKHYVTDDNIARLDVEVQKLRQRSTSLAEYAQAPWPKTLRCGLVSSKKSFKVLYVENVTHQICKHF